VSCSSKPRTRGKQGESIHQVQEAQGQCSDHIASRPKPKSESGARSTWPQLPARPGPGRRLTPSSCTEASGPAFGAGRDGGGSSSFPLQNKTKQSKAAAPPPGLRSQPAWLVRAGTPEATGGRAPARVDPPGPSPALCGPQPPSTGSLGPAARPSPGRAALGLAQSPISAASPGPVPPRSWGTCSEHRHSLYIISLAPCQGRAPFSPRVVQTSETPGLNSVLHKASLGLARPVTKPQFLSHSFVLFAAPGLGPASAASRGESHSTSS